MIKSFKHKGLAALYKDGKTKGVQQKNVDRLELILTVLNEAQVMPDDMSLTTFRTHKLHGDLKDYWSVKVNGNWRVIFRFVNGHAEDVDLTDYH